MHNTALKPLMGVAGAIALSLTVETTPVQAVTLVYDFTVTVTSGNYAGSYQGNFSFDNAVLTGTATEFVTPSKGNLRVLFNFLNTTFTEVDDRDYQADFPLATFTEGNLVGLDFFVLPSSTVPSFRIVSKNDPQGISEGFHLGVLTSFDDNKVGEVEYRLRTGGSNSGGQDPDPVAIPEPSEIAGSLLALGLFGLGLKLRKKPAALPK